MVYNNILDAMGHTPIVRLNHMAPENAAEILVKFEGLNVGGSIKTRTAYNMICDAEARGVLKPDSIIVEPTSGNQGIGLALIGAVKGYRTIIIMPDSVSEERRKLVRHYGAEVIIIHDAGDIGACIQECLDTALRMAKEDPKIFVPQQFENPANPAVHYQTTGPEIWRDTDGEVDIFVAGVGTGGTLSGAGKYLKEQNPAVQVVAVEPDASPVLSGGKAGAHKIQGIGAGFIPGTLDTGIYDEILRVKNEDAFAAGRAVAATEGLLIGISGGAAVHAAGELARRPENRGKMIVALLPDTGERDLSTPLFAAKD